MGLGDDLAAALATVMPILRHTERLIAFDNRMSDDSIVRIVKAVKSMPSLTHLGECSRLEGHTTYVLYTLRPDSMLSEDGLHPTFGVSLCEDEQALYHDETSSVRSFYVAFKQAEQFLDIDQRAT